MPNHPARRKRKFARSGLIGVLVLFALMLTTYSPTFAAEPAPPDVVAPAQGDVGYVGPNYGTSGNSTPTGEKPESKLWWADGRWWAVMYNGSAAQYRIYWLNLSNQQWQDTGFATGNRPSDKVDVLWVESSQKLYMTSHVFSTSPSTSGAAPQLFRYSYNSGSKTFSLDSGFPVSVGVGRMEALVIDRDSTGRLWITYLQDRLPMVAHSTTNDQTWSAPFAIPGAQQASSDDISSVIAFGGNKIGVVWSDQSHDAYYLAIHNDGAAPNAWTIETAIQGNGLVDDHINLATDNSGRLYVAGKTSLTGSNPLVVLDVRQAAGGWSRSVFGMDADGHTRPIVVVDSQNQKIHMFATSPESGGAIYYKTANMGSNPSFPTGKGQVFANPASGELNNPTSTKQQVNSTTGLVVLASNNPTDTYHHNYVPLGGGPPPTTPPPTTPPPTTPPPTTPPPTTPPPTTPPPTTPPPTTPPPTTPPPTTPPPTTPPPTTPPPGSELTFSPVHDTYVKSESPTKVYGTQEFVRVRGAASANHDAYFKFNVTGTGGSVQSATLRLYTYDGGPDGGTLYLASNNFLSSSTPWTETGMNWNNAPGSQGSALANIGNAITNTWIELNVTAAITGDGTYSFMLTNGNSNSVFFHSKEAAGLRPELVIVTTGGSTTPPPTTPPPTTPPPTTPPPTTPPPTTPPPTTPPPGGLLEFAPIADTHVKTDRATSNYGTEPFVRLRKTTSVDYDSYFKFNVTGTGGSVQSATLWLYSYDGGPDGGSIYVASNNFLNSSTPWTENGLNWNNAPGVSGSPLDSVGNVVNNTWVSFNVTAAIAGDGTFSFALSNNDSNSVFYYSKEAANFRPRLEIDTGSAALSASFAALSMPEVEFESEDFDTQELAITPVPVVTTPAPVIYSLPFADDFALGTNWTASGAWQHDALAGLNSASAGWFANSAARGLDSTLQLNGLIDLTTVLSPTLTYQQKAILTAGDRVVVEVSGDGGETWVAVSEEIGAISEWAQRSVDLSAVSGQIVALRFRLDTTAELPAGTTSVGLWLDDVAVGLIELPTPVVEPTDEPTPVTETPATEVPPTVELPTEVPTEVPTDAPTDEPTSETPVVPPVSGLLTVESDDPAVIASGLWTAHDTAEASGGRYVYSSGALTDTLTLGFTGTQVDVIFVIHPALGSFAVEVDGAQLQIVSSTGDQAFGARTSITGLADGAHTLRIVPVSGTIAIDAFAVAGLAPAAPVPPVVDPVLPPVVETPAVPTEEPTTLPQPDVIVPPVTPTATPLPVTLPYFDAFEVEQTWVADGDWVYALNSGYLGSGWYGYANERGAINTLTLAYQLDLRTAIAPQLTFWQMADLQGDELFSVEVSVDGGLSWLPIDLQPGWTGAWTQRTVDLTGFRGTIIGLRFALIAGPSNQNTANRPSMVAIDELAVQEYVAPTPTTLPTELPTQEPVTAPQVVTPEPTLPPTEIPTQEPVVEPPLQPTEAPTIEVLPPPTEEPTQEPIQEPAPTEESAEGGAQ